MSAEQAGESGPAVTARELVRTAVVPAAPDAVWELVGRFGALDAWHPYVPKAAIEGGGDPEQPGAVRVFSIEGTVVAREELLARDTAARVYSYAVLESLLPLREYVATLAVRPHPLGSEIVWSARHLADEAVAAQVEEVFGEGTYGGGLAALRGRFTE